MCGLRVKITYTFSADGTMAPIFIPVLGITEREMPRYTIILIKIKGLCVGGKGVSMGAQQYGIIIFICSENAMDKKRYQIYRDKILIHFIAQPRSEYGEWSVGMTISKELRASSWCDENLAHIDNIINDTSLKFYKENNISANKQNSARSATEKATDLAKVFKIMPATEQKITVRNIPSDRHPMKCTIYNILQKLANENKIILRSSKNYSIVDFVSCVPETTTKAV